MTEHINFPPDYERNSVETLETALGQLGAYESWRAYDPGPTADADKRYTALPALTKRDIREHFPQGFVPPGRDYAKGIASGEICEVKNQRHQRRHPRDEHLEQDLVGRLGEGVMEAQFSCGAFGHRQSYGSYPG